MNPLNKVIADLKREELIEALNEIAEWHKTAVLRDGIVRKVARNISKITNDPFHSLSLAETMLLRMGVSKYIEEHKKPKKIETKRITVYDYDDSFHGSGPARPETETPVKYEVDAWCVQGETGFRAFFYVDDHFCEAYGDDGHWWMKGRMHKHWVKEFKQVVAAIEEK